MSQGNFDDTRQVLKCTFITLQCNIYRINAILGEEKYQNEKKSCIEKILVEQ